jgi:hypothetical protein
MEAPRVWPRVELVPTSWQRTVWDFGIYCRVGANCKRLVVGRWFLRIFKGSFVG